MRISNLQSSGIILVYQGAPYDKRRVSVTFHDPNQDELELHASVIGNGYTTYGTNAYYPGFNDFNIFFPAEGKKIK